MLNAIPSRFHERSGFKLMGPFQGCPAHHAKRATGIGGLAAGLAVEELRGHFPISATVAQIDLEDFVFDIFLAEFGIIPEKLPHCLTGEREPTHLLFEIGNVFGKAVHLLGLVLRLIGGPLGTVNTALLVALPDHVD